MTTTLIIIAAAYFLAGFVDAISGGGGIITVPVLMLTGVPIHFIAGTNQCAALFGGITASYEYVKKKKIHMKAALITGLISIPGTYMGARLNMIVSELVLKRLMIFLLPVVLLVMVLNKGFGAEDHSEELSSRKMIFWSAISGFLIGMYQGFYGPGAGMFYTIVMTVCLKLDLLRGSGTARLAGTISCISATLTYAFSGLIIWKIAVIASIAIIGGNYLGAKLAIKNGMKIIRPLMYTVTILLLIRLLLDAFGIM